MVREDDTTGGPARQKGTPVRPTTLDLDAVEISSESPAAPPEGFEAKAGSEAPAGSEPEAAVPQGGETPQGPVAATDEGVHPWGLEAGADRVAATPEGVPEVQPEPKLDVFEARAQEGVETADPGTGAAEATIPGAPGMQPPPKLDDFHTPPPRSRLPIVIAALAGGIAGAIVVLAAFSFGLVPLNRDNDDFSPRLAAAEQDIASNKSAIDQAASRAAAAEEAAKTARDAANNALNLAGDARKAATADTAENAAPAVPPVDVGPLTDRLAKAEADIAGLHAALDEAARTQTAALSPVSEQASAAATTASQVQNDLHETQKQVAALAASTGAASNKAAAYAVALGEIAQAMRDGKPFGAELKTATGIAGNADALAPLRAAAETGVPSTDALAASFEALRPQIVAAMTPKPAPLPADAGVMDRLMSSLGHVVVITRDGDGSPDDPAAPAQKVSGALHRGDLAGAVAAFKAMPEAGQQAGSAWLAQASGAIQALTIVKAETDAALQKLSGQ